MTAVLVTAASILGMAMAWYWARPARTSGGPVGELPSQVANPGFPSSPVPVDAVQTPSLVQAPGSQEDSATNELSAPNPRVAEVYQLAMRRDASVRQTLLAELSNPDPSVRRAALDGVVQLGDRSVIPRLREIEAQTEDTVEKAEILEAINYIDLPSLTEYLAERRTNGSVRTNIPRSSANRVRTARQ